MRTAIYIVVFIILSIGIAFTIRSTDIEKVVTDRNDKKDKKNKEEPAASPDIGILEKHDVPSVLKEISALVYLDKNRFACVQDELGKIFIYNTDTRKLEKEIPFAASADYEGLAIVEQTAYVLRADGQIFEVKNYLGAKPSARIHKTHLTARHNTEGLCYDGKNNRLLIAIKDTDPENPQYKGIYSFSLSSMKMENEPDYKIDLNSAALRPFKSKKQGSQMQPSAIAIHPKTGDLYITDGAKPKLLIMDQQGAIKTVKILNSKEFNQPEGISFSPEGGLFISNEGSKQPGNITEVKYPNL